MLKCDSMVERQQLRLFSCTKPVCDGDDQSDSIINIPTLMFRLTLIRNISNSVILTTGGTDTVWIDALQKHTRGPSYFAVCYVERSFAVCGR